MARRKNTETSEAIQEQEVVQATEQPEIETVTQDNEEPANDLVQKAETSADEASATQTDIQPSVSVEIPEYVQKILASYPNYPCLYVDAKGGVYPQHTQPNLVSGAILYQNPYYKQ